jgi:hypothetical protein
VADALAPLALFENEGMVAWLDMKDKRFVIQEHSTCGGPEGVHWDLMLEQDDILATFRLHEPPGQVLVHAVRAERIFDHPLRFLWYEGPVQNGTGRVRIVDRGTWRPARACDHLVFDGAILHGAFTLTGITETEWRLHRCGRTGRRGES